MRGRFVGRAVLVGMLVMGASSACGDDDEAATDTTAPSGDAGDATGDNTLEVEMVDYGYEADGELGAGLVTIASTNTGDEWHMAGFGRLKEGRTVGELLTALQDASEGEGGPAGPGGPTETTGAGATLRAAAQETTTTTGGGQPGGEDEGGEEGDPFAEFIDEELGAPGHVLQPGQRQSLTVDLDPGSYVMLCFLPTEGEGTPHFLKGMVGGFEVAEETADVDPPQADATITLGDEAEPSGVPGDLDAGEHTFEVTSSGTAGKDFVIAQLDEGEDLSSFDEYFEGEEGFDREGGPPEGYAQRAPGTVLASTFEIAPGQTVWVTADIPEGEVHFVGSTNTDDEDTVDKFVTVQVS
ncbi:MAG TPA: hypothetical protein VM263_03250 [Acidimicrobiales bacterium]|nr:hypothetical protein [Acidimicrobiales bacterium]